MKSNILVIGGTGKTGRKVVQKLQDLQQNVRIGSRRESPAFDWQEPATWPAALEGMEKAYVTFQPDLAVPGALEAIEKLVDLARQSGLRKMVLLSGKGEREAELCEEVVKNSGLDYTIVRASWFNQNFSESFFLDPILAGQVALPQAGAEVPYVDTDDIAEVVVEVLLNETHNGHTYELTGPRTWTFPEVMQEISEATGRQIGFSPISLPAYLQMLEQLQVPADYIWLIGYLFKEVLATEGNHLVTHDIEKVLGRKAKDFSEYVRETAATGVWTPRVAETT
ncbi:MAG: NAD(P)H-binding protein, partial [Saprospiraceae bacterium]|nr:NAD(P)H-binding protein [Saprospiraceae bacterium]